MHDRKPKPRTYRGEAEVADLLEWLNAKNPSDLRQQARAEVASIFRLVLCLYEMANKSNRKGPSEEFKSEQTRLNEWLVHYEFVNRVDYGNSGVTWSLSNSADLLARPYVKGEAECVACIVELARMGMISRVRQCECGQYFFVRFPKTQRFHSKECREQFWEASSERKEQKRQNARKYYKLHKYHNMK